MSPIVKTKEIIKKLPDQKRHLDFLAALLSVPVMLTVLILNLSNLQNKKAPATITPTPTPSQQSIYAITPTQIRAKTTSLEQSSSTTPSPATAACNSDIGPISIVDPAENATVSDNPTCIDISYQANGYCAVVWSYKINNGNWSDYSNNSVCLYNLPQGANTFSLRVKSLVSGKEQILQRTFTYTGSSQAITPTPTVSVSITPTPTVTN